MLNRAPTLHRLGIQAFLPRLVEGKAIQLHPLVCTGFNADFDGDQMAVHVPLSNEACLEALVLMLASHNILHPANGNPITLPTQDMVLGVYYLTKDRPGAKGEGLTFGSPEEVEIAYNEEVVAKHARIKVRIPVRDEETNEVIIDAETGRPKTQLVDTTVGRMLFNKIVPEGAGFVNMLLSKKSMRKVIAKIYLKVGLVKTVNFLDDLKTMGFQEAFKGGLSFSLGEVLIPEEKTSLIEEAESKIDEVMMNFNMGLITENERYNQVIDIWTHTNSKLTDTLMNHLENDRDGFNNIYMMFHSGARGSKEQIRQLGGMRGLMAKPQKTLKGSSGAIIENPILSNFKEGLSVLEYFISTHGARKGLADTALKTADAGYLTRRLVDVAQDVIITEHDCGTLRGLTISALKENEDEIQPLGERILGRVALDDIVHPISGEIMVNAGDEITDDKAEEIDESPIEEVEIRSVLTCESKQGVCASCYGRNLANGKLVQVGEAVGVMAAQSIGEPGTQLTLRTFHIGGAAQRIAAVSELIAKFSGKLQLENVREVDREVEGEKKRVVVSRTGKVKILDDQNRILFSNKIPYGSDLKVKDGQDIEKGESICSWDPHNSLIVSEFKGKVVFIDVKEGQTFLEHSDTATGYKDKIIIDSRDRTVNPTLSIIGEDGEEIRAYNLPVGAHLIVEDGDDIEAGETLAKIPRAGGGTADITGGLPRVTELFEARNPSNPAVVSAIEGMISLGGIKRGNREVFVTAPDDSDKRKYLVSLSKHILVHDGDYVMAGEQLSDGAIAPKDILSISGPSAVQSYIVNEIQEVYRMQGVPINDKHIEVIVRQMMRKVEIVDSGNTIFLEKEIVDKIDFQEENDWIFDKLYVVDPGGSTRLKAGQIVSRRKLRDENSQLRRSDLELVKAEVAKPAICQPVLRGITRASLGTKSWLSAASFQETTKVLSEAAITAKTDELNGLKENVIVGHLVPAGTGIRRYQDILVGPKEEDQKEKDVASKEEKAS
jgi:DNA-directed RNA polymerase subunit beta'